MGCCHRLFLRSIEGTGTVAGVCISFVSSAWNHPTLLFFPYFLRRSGPVVLEDTARPELGGLFPCDGVHLVPVSPGSQIQMPVSVLAYLNSCQVVLGASETVRSHQVVPLLVMLRLNTDLRW